MATVRTSRKTAPVRVEQIVPRDLSAIVPSPYEGYRDPLRDCLVFFLEGLSSAHQLEIFALQAELPSDAPPIERVMALLHACPSLHKLGQVVARDRRLDEALRQRLIELESLPGLTPVETLRGVLREELGAEADSLEIEPPLAEGSVCAVTPFRRLGGGAHAHHDGVLKIVKPGVEEKLDEELALWPAVGERLEAQCRRRQLVTPDWRDALEQVAELLRTEVHLDAEQGHLDEAGEFYADDRRVIIPNLLEPCTPRITAMTRVPGTRVTELAAGRARRARLGASVVEAMVARPMLAPRGASLFHADPHAGNLLATEDGRLGIVDWSLVGRLSKSDRVQMAQIVVGAFTLDRRRIARAVERLSRSEARWVDVQPVIDEALAEVRRGTVPGFDWVSRLLDRLVIASAAHFPSHLLLFRKSLLTLGGVIADVSEDLPRDLVLAAAVTRQLLKDWPRRALSGPFSRDFGSHLNNAEMLALLGAPTLTSLRYLHQSLRDRLDSSLAAPA